MSEWTEKCSRTGFLLGFWDFLAQLHFLSLDFFFFFFIDFFVIICDWWCRKSCRVLATVLKEDEEEVVIEESFPPKASPVEKGEGGSEGGAENSSSNGLDKWIIKLEQSVNVLLTVKFVQEKWSPLKNFSSCSDMLNHGLTFTNLFRIQL